jgi:hypothetical protein
MCLVMATAVPAAAQTQIGLRAGVSIADLSVDDDEFEPDSKTGFLAGAFVELPLGGNLSFQPGASFVQKGAEESDGDATLSLELNYIEFPLLFKYAFPTTGSVGVHLSAGPAVAFETSCKVSVEGTGVELNIGCDEGDSYDIEVETTSVDIGAMLGGGLAFDVGRAQLMVDAFYNFGLKNIDDTGGDESVKNRAIYATVGASFPVGR